MSKYWSVNLFTIWLTKINIAVGKVTWHEKLVGSKSWFKDNQICILGIFEVSWIGFLVVYLFTSVILLKYPEVLKIAL